MKRTVTAVNTGWPTQWVSDEKKSGLVCMDMAVEIDHVPAKGIIRES